MVRSLTITLNRSSPTPIPLQIAEALRHRIISGEVAPGDRLPSTRNLAHDFGISRGAAITAYEQLLAEGYIEGRRGSGYFVCPLKIGEPSPLGEGKRVPRARPPDHRPAPARIFQPGMPDMRLFPFKSWARTVARVARSVPQSTVLGKDPFGDPRLRAAIADHLAEWRGIKTSPERIVITAGSENGLEICIGALAKTARRIGLENPGYLRLRQFVLQLGLGVDWLPVGPQGAELPRREPDLVVLTPSHQFPLGGAMPLNRRLDYLQWAKNAGAWIIEDDYDSEFRYAGHPIPALMSLDRDNRTFYLGSFSKTFSADLRIGFLVLPPQLADSAAAAIAGQGTQASIMPQRPLAVFMENGDFHRHIRRARRNYAERRAALINGLQGQFGARRISDAPGAGMQFAFMLDDGHCDQELARHAAGLGLGPAPLSKYYVGKAKKAGLLLGFCAHTIDEIERHLPVLLQCLHESRRGPRRHAPAALSRYQWGVRYLA